MSVDKDENRLAFEQSRDSAIEGCMCLLAAFRYLGVPKTMLDVGCGPGHMAKCAGAVTGSRSFGFDPRLEYTTETFEGVAGLYKCDDKQAPSFLGLSFESDMVLCLEVAEHLAASDGDHLCDSLSSWLSADGVLLFSAATPGQGGAGHVNEQPHEYWIEKLVARGLRSDLEAEVALRREWSQLAPNAWWYGRNLLVFRRDEP